MPLASFAETVVAEEVRFAAPDGAEIAINPAASNARGRIAERRVREGRIRIRGSGVMSKPFDSTGGTKLGSKSRWAMRKGEAWKGFALVEHAFAVLRASTFWLGFPKRRRFEKGISSSLFVVLAQSQIQTAKLPVMEKFRILYRQGCQVKQGKARLSFVARSSSWSSGRCKQALFIKSLISVSDLASSENSRMSF
jgi:hypothetical protein